MNLKQLSQIVLLVLVCGRSSQVLTGTLSKKLAKFDTPLIRTLTATSIFDAIDRTMIPKNLSIIVFFDPMCPHCKKFAPKLTRIVRSIASKFPTVKWYSIDAGKYFNTIRSFKVKYFPYLVIYEKKDPILNMPADISETEGDAKLWLIGNLKTILDGRGLAQVKKTGKALMLDEKEQKRLSVFKGFLKKIKTMAQQRTLTQKQMLLQQGVKIKKQAQLSQVQINSSANVPKIQ